MDNHTVFIFRRYVCGCVSRAFVFTYKRGVWVHAFVVKKRHCQPWTFTVVRQLQRAMFAFGWHVASVLTVGRCSFFFFFFFPLKAYSLMLDRGRSQNFQNLNFLHIFVDLLQEAPFLKGIKLKSFQYEMRAIFTKSLVHETLFNTVVYGRNKNTHNNA